MDWWNAYADKIIARRWLGLILLLLGYRAWPIIERYITINEDLKYFLLGVSAFIVVPILWRAWD